MINKALATWVSLVCGGAVLYVGIMIAKNGYLYFEEPSPLFLAGDIIVGIALIGSGLLLMRR